MKSSGKPKIHGFTLVELLVVIVIIAVLASVAFTMGRKALGRGKAAEALQNIRQIGPVMTTYATDHNMKLPPIKAPTTLPDGTTADQIWHEACLALLFPSTNYADFKTKEWWDKNKTFFRNPLLKPDAKPRGFTPENPGYGMNEMMAENLAIASTGSAPGHEELITVSVPLASLSDPGRTPMVAPCDDIYFRFDDRQLAAFNTGTLKALLVEDKIPVLFVDGHIESVTPKEYGQRRLFAVPNPAPQ